MLDERPRLTLSFLVWQTSATLILSRLSFSEPRYPLDSISTLPFSSVPSVDVIYVRLSCRIPWRMPVSMDLSVYQNQVSIGPQNQPVPSIRARGPLAWLNAIHVRNMGIRRMRIADNTRTGTETSGSAVCGFGSRVASMLKGSSDGGVGCLCGRRGCLSSVLVVDVAMIPLGVEKGFGPKR